MCISANPRYVKTLRCFIFNYYFFLLVFRQRCAQLGLGKYHVFAYLVLLPKKMAENCPNASERRKESSGCGLNHYVA